MNDAVNLNVKVGLIQQPEITGKLHIKNKRQLSRPFL